MIEVASDNDFSGGARDENADGDPLNDPTPLPGLRLVKAERVFPGPTDRAAYPTAYDAVFEYTIENTGGMPLQDIALADFFLENEAVKAVLEVDVQALQSDSQTFTASRLPGSFIGLDTVQRFEDGVATLMPGETLTVVAEVVFAFDAERMDQDLLSRAAAFSQVDLDGDGQLDTVVIDPADMGRSAGFDANGDGEEGNDVLPLSIGRLAVSTVLDGGLVMSASGQGDSLVLTAETTVRNTGVAPLSRVSADLPLPEGWRDALLAVIAPPSIVSTPRDDFDVITRQGYDGLRGVRAIEGIETLAAGEQVRFAVTLELDPLAIDPASLSLLQASARAELDRDQDGLGDLTLDAVQAPTELALSTGESLIDGLIAAQADPADAPAADPNPPVATAPSAPLSNTAFTPARDGEGLATPAAAEAEALPQIAASVSSFVPAEDGQGLSAVTATQGEGFATFEINQTPGSDPAPTPKGVVAEPAPDLAAAPQTDADFASETDGTFDFATDFEAALDWESGPAVDPIDQFQQQAKAAAKPTPQNTSPSLYTAPYSNSASCGRPRW